MTDSPSRTVPAARLQTSSGVLWMLFLAPFLLAIGAFITVAMLPFVTDLPAKGDAVLMAWVGAILLCLGITFLIAGIVLVGVRSLLQRQAELLRTAQPEIPGE